jgi:hypothetical protein
MQKLLDSSWVYPKNRDFLLSHFVFPNEDSYQYTFNTITAKLIKRCLIATKEKRELQQVQIIFAHLE